MAKKAKKAVGPCKSEGLRRLAEAVDGMRGQDVKVYRRRSDGEFFPDFKNEKPDDSDYLFTANTPKNRPDRKKPSVDDLSRAIRESIQKHKYEADAIFWSEASVEKFVWPYYAAHRIDVKAVKKLWNMYDDVVAILHLYPTVPAAARADKGLMVGVLGASKGTEEFEVNFIAPQDYLPR